MKGPFEPNLDKIAKKAILLLSTSILFPGESVVAIGGSNPMQDCFHEEADTRMVVHVVHALEHGAKTIQIQTVDTDVFAILIGKYHMLEAIESNRDIWIAFGMGRHFCFYHVNSICAYLGKERSQALPVFHAYTGCDTTSAFHGKGRNQHGRHGLHIQR